MRKVLGDGGDEKKLVLLLASLPLLRRNSSHQIILKQKCYLALPSIMFCIYLV